MLTNISVAKRALAPVLAVKHNHTGTSPDISTIPTRPYVNSSLTAPSPRNSHGTRTRTYYSPSVDFLKSRTGIQRRSRWSGSDLNIDGSPNFIAEPFDS